MKKFFMFFAIVFTAIFLIACDHINEIKVTFDYNDGVTANKVITVDTNGKIDVPANPTREGYKFEGWELDNKIVDFNTESFTKSVKVVAKWTKLDDPSDPTDSTVPSDTTVPEVIKYTVSFVDVDNNVLLDPVQIEKGKKVTEPTLAPKKGFVFLGWYLNNALFDFNSPINQNTKLVAKWEAASTSITEDDFYDLLEDVELNINFDRPWKLTANVDLEIEFSEIVNEELMSNVILALEGDIFVYFDLSSYEDLIIQIEGELDVALTMPIDENTNLEFEGTVVLNAYLFNSNLYVELRVSGLGVDLHIKEKVEGFVLEELYDSVISEIGIIDTEDVDLSEGLDFILSIIDFEDLAIIEKENSVLVNIPLADILGFVFSEMENLEEYYDEEFGEYSRFELIVHEATFTNSIAFIEFSDQLERIGAQLNINVDIENIYEYIYEDEDYHHLSQTRTTVRGTVNFELDLNASEPTLVKENELTGFNELDQVKRIFNMIFGEPIFDLDDLPVIDKTVSESNLEIDRDNRELLDIDEETLLENLEGVSIELPIDVISRIQADFDIYFLNNVITEYSDGDFYGDYRQVKVVGDLDIYLDLTSYEDLYIYVILNMDIEAIIGDENLKVYFAGDVSLKLYLIGSDLYVDIQAEIEGINLSVQVKVPNVVSEEMFDMLFDEISDIEGLEMLDDLSELVGMLFDFVPFEAFEIYGTSSFLDIELPLDDFIGMILADFEEDYEDEFNIIKTEVTNLEVVDSFILARFSNILDMVAGSINIELEMQDIYQTLYDDEIEYSNINYIEVIGRLDFIAEFDIAALPNLKTANDFNDFYEIDETVLFLVQSLFGAFMF